MAEPTNDPAATNTAPPAPATPAPASEPAADSAATPPQAAPHDPISAMTDSEPTIAEALRREWSGDFDANVGFAKAAAAAFADPDLVDLLNETGLGDDPRIVRVAARIGRALRGAAPAAGASSTLDRANPGAPNPHMIEAEIEQLIKRPDYWSDHVQKRVRQLYLALHGDQPIAVHRERGDAAGLR